VKILLEAGFYNVYSAYAVKFSSCSSKLGRLGRSMKT